MSVMRGTTKLNNANSLYYMTRNFNALNSASTKLALQQQVVQLQDNALAANIGIKMAMVIDRASQYVRNINTTGIPAMRFAEKYITDSKTEMDKIKSIATGAANAGATTAEQRSAYQQELGAIFKQLVSFANASDGTRYVFGGQNTTTPPFTIVGGRYVNYVGNKAPVNLVVDNNSTVALNVSGDQVYGNMTTTIPSRNMNPDVNLGTDRSTPLSALNGGAGVPKGKILVKYSAYPDGLEVDLSTCDTLEDVKDTIEKATLDASRKLSATECPWLDSSNLDWKDMQDRYVKVTMNPDNNGISLQEFDLGEPLPQPTASETRRGLAYSGNPGYLAGDRGVAQGLPAGETTIHDKVDPRGNRFTLLSVDDRAGNKVAEGLGIKGTANVYDATDPDSLLDGFLHGRDLNPSLHGGTLLADIEGYNDASYTFTNGGKPASISIIEQGGDTNDYYSNWALSGVSPKTNTGENGELYARVVTDDTTTPPERRVEVYTRPIDKASSSDLVATGRYTAEGSTVVLKEANNSGLSGSVRMNVPATVREAEVELKVEMDGSLRNTVHVPAFIEELDPNGQPRDILNLASGWNIRGLDKPPAGEYDINHHASTDLEGDVSVNYRYDETDGYMYVELSRPAYADQPAKRIATGRLFVGTPIPAAGLDKAVSGRVEFEGEPGFEGVSGSVYLEIPKGATFTGTVVGADAANATTTTFALQEAAPGGAVVFGGAVELVAGLRTDGTAMTLAGDTVFKAGQSFDNDVRLPSGGTLPAGTVLTEDTLIRKGVSVQPTGGVIQPGTVLAEGQRVVVEDLPAPGGIPMGTVIPRGSYYEAGPGFPAAGMGISTPTATVATAGYDVRATFATVEDFQRAVHEAGVYVDVAINSRGDGLEFSSTLAGAWLTVSEDTDCYEQMGDAKQQLTALDLNGLVKGVNTDSYGNAFTEVVYYPPQDVNPDGSYKKIKLHAENGDIIELDPGYYVRVYSDKSQLDVPYAERDNSKLVCEGFVQAGAENPAFDEAQALADPAYAAPRYLQSGTMAFPPGIMENMLLEERNNSGVSGTVNLDYYGDRKQFAVEMDADGNPVALHFDADNQDNISVFPGGFRVQGGLHTTIQEVDLYNPIPGVVSDYAGTVHGTITKVDPAPPAPAHGIDMTLYKDNSRTHPVAASDPAETAVNGTITLYELTPDGRDWATDANGNRIVAGTINVDATSLDDGESENFTFTTGGIRNGGQEREENVFSTINDLIDALARDDDEALHNLIEDAQRDIDRALTADGDLSARQKRLELLVDRHNDDIINYKGIFTSRVGMDDQALAMGVLNFQAATNAYDAAMQVSMTVMQMSLLQYL